MRLLIVEDSERLRRSMRVALEARGFAVDTSDSISRADGFLESYVFDVIVLDLGLPDGDGLELLNRSRRNGLATPVLILSARDQVEDRIAGLNAGADDYLIKPFDFDELEARLHALIRRAASESSQEIDLGIVVINRTKKSVYVGIDKIELSKSEYRLLECLGRNRGRVFDRHELIERLYAGDRHVSSNIIDVTIHHLRKRLKQACGEEIVKTKRGFGYFVD